MRVSRWFLFALAFFGIVVPSLAAAPSDDKAAKVKLILNWKPESEFGGFYDASIGGTYKSKQLDVDVVPGGVGTPVVQMVATGKYEFGVSSADEVVISRSKGSDVVGLFAVYQTCPQGLMAREEKSGNTLGEWLASGTLAVQKGLPHFLFLEKKFGPIKAKVVPYQGGINQLVTDKDLSQQCYVTSEPILARRAGLKVRTILFADAGYNPYATLVITRRSYLEKNKDLVHRFLDATEVGWASYLKDPKRANEKMSQLNPTMDIATLEESAKIQQPLIETSETKQAHLGLMTRARWESASKLMQDLKLVSKIESPEKYFYDWKSDQKH